MAFQTTTKFFPLIPKKDSNILSTESLDILFQNLPTGISKEEMLGLINGSSSSKSILFVILYLILIRTIDLFHYYLEYFRIGVFDIDLALLSPHILNRPINQSHMEKLAQEFNDPLKFTFINNEGLCIAQQEYPVGKNGPVFAASGMKFVVISGNHHIAAAKTVQKSF